MKHYSLLRRFLRNETGETIVEFAIVSTVFFMIFFGIIEFGLIMFTKVAIESATEQVARSSGVNTVGAPPSCVADASPRVCALKALIMSRTAGLLDTNYLIITSKVVSLASTASPPDPDICLDTVGVPHPATCSAHYIDNNHNGAYDAYTASTDADVGTANQLVEIRASYTWKVMVPLLQPFFPNGGTYSMSSTTVVKDEPYGGP